MTRFQRARIIAFNFATAPAYLWIALWCRVLGLNRIVRISVSKV